VKDSIDAETEALMEKVFPCSPDSSGDLSSGRIFAVIPEELVGADLQRFSTFMEQVFDAGDGFDEVLESLAAGDSEQDRAPRRMEVVIPDSLLGEAPGETAAFLDRVFEAFEEIDQVLAVFQQMNIGVPEIDVRGMEKELLDEDEGKGVGFLRAVDRVPTNQEKLHLMIRQTRHELKRLKPFRLARKSPGRLLSDIRSSGELPTLQYIVEFLHSIHLAADSFEKIGIPRPHIRDYLEFLYRMEDWEEMNNLVSKLHKAVKRYAIADAGGKG